MIGSVDPDPGRAERVEGEDRVRVAGGPVPASAARAEAAGPGRAGRLTRRGGPAEHEDGSVTVGKKMEGDEEERRAAAREVAGAGENPGARNETTGAYKPRTHPRRGGSVTHEDRMPAEPRGERQWRPGDPAEERIQDPEAGPETVVTDEGRHEPSPPARPATNPQAPAPGSSSQGRTSALVTQRPGAPRRGGAGWRSPVPGPPPPAVTPR